MRLVSGLTLFLFALTHFLNHALGLWSLDAMLAAQRWRLAVTRSPPGELLLGMALIVHLALALWRIARLRTWRLPRAAIWQLASGALIAILVTGHFYEAGVGPCTGDSVDMGLIHPNEASYSGYKSKGTVTWHVTPDVMVYATWSQGYRPGNFNRKGGLILKGPDLYTAANAPTPAQIGAHIPQYEKPTGYAPDTLVNKEIGWKTQFLDRRLQVNGSYYQETWTNVQTALYNPLYFGNLTFGTNGPDFEVKGFELQFVARLTEGLTAQASGSWNKTKQLNSPNLVGNVAASASFGQPITSYFTGITPANPTGITQLANPFGNPDRKSVV